MAMFTFALILALSRYVALGHARSTPSSSLHRRAETQQVAIACFAQSAQSTPPCVCPTDLLGDTNGVLINFYPGYQCAYTGGACTWNDGDGALQNTRQTNCPNIAPCPTTGCTCPTDNNGDSGVLINVFTGYQCAYAAGACTWDFEGVGVLQNTQQTNCPTEARCVPPA